MGIGKYRISIHSILYFFLVCPITFLISCNSDNDKNDSYPESFDDRITISLIASSPDIVTPIGITIDKQDQIYFLESHTHTPLSEYQGPKFDRIMKGIDSNGDGIPESWKIYADSIMDGMNLFSGPDNHIFLTSKDGAFSFSDTDQDGVADVKNTLLRMVEPDNVYDHAGILGLTIQNEWIYISRGNTGGLKWKIQGSDGRELNGYGDGGNVFRCKLDGSELEEVATGFWNPFDLKFDHLGKLMLIDNDPDSRGPNRLLEIVKGGDYGYQSIYGGSGIHPFLAWNGELPGTLPYSAGLGEAPSGLLDAAFSNLPKDYARSLLVSIWEENSIVTVPLLDGENRIYGEPKILFKGDSTFHPVAFATNSKGDIYLTDWVKRAYPNHGLGKIWKISGPQNEPIHVDRVLHKNGFDQRIENLDSPDKMKALLKNGDPFEQAVARDQLLKLISKEDLISMLEGSDKELQMQALLMLQKTDFEVSDTILKSLLRDQDPKIQQMTMIYIATKGRVELKGELEKALRENKIPTYLFDTFLATISHLDPEYVSNYASKEEVYSRGLKRKLPKDYVFNLVKDPAIPAEVKSIAIPYIDQPYEHVQDLLELLQNEPIVVKAALLQTFKKIPNKEAESVMLGLAENEQVLDEIRSDAIIALSYNGNSYCQKMTALLKDDSELIQETALNYLCSCSDDQGIASLVKSTINKNERLEAIWNNCGGETPSTVNGTENLSELITSGDPVRGKMIFQLQKSQCTNCHQVDGWGGILGPDLSNIGSSKNENLLVSAILEPSAEISPEWQGWYLVNEEGKTVYGRQIDVGSNEVEIMMQNGEFETFKNVKEFGPSEKSLMPENLINQFTTAEFIDLIAYLKTLN